MTMLIRAARILLSALMAMAVSSCGLVEENMWGCDGTGLIKTYRGLGCQKVCKAKYSTCANGKNADPEKDCECTKDVVGVGIPIDVPTTIASSCVCYKSGSTDYVNLHLAGTCPRWLPKLGTGDLITGIGRPIGSGEDSTCTSTCASWSSTELRGVFKFRSQGPGHCTPDATMFPGTILGEYVSGGELAESRDDAPPLFIARAGLRMQKLNYRLAALPLATAGFADEGGTGKAVFNMVKLGVDCMKECIAGGENCTEFKISGENKAGIMSILAALPADGVATRIDIATLRRQSFLNVPTACPHTTIDVGKDGSVKSAGAHCEQQLYLAYPGIKDFVASVSFPAMINARASATPSSRTIEFSDENAMMSLRLSPNQLHQLYGGKVRAISSSSERLTFETQNSCIAIALKP